MSAEPAVFASKPLDPDARRGCDRLPAALRRAAQLQPRQHCTSHLWPVLGPLTTPHAGPLATIVAPFGQNIFREPNIRPYIRSYGLKTHGIPVKNGLFWPKSTECTTEYSPYAEWPNPYGGTMLYALYPLSAL